MKHQIKVIEPEILARIKVVLVNTTHPGNIGATARAMKNMGLSQLVLVEPRDFPSLEAYSRSAGANDILDSARVVSSLDNAVKNCIQVVGTSARSRTIDWPVYSPPDAAENVIRYASEGDVAIVFGRESSGLTNRELEKCHALMHIPANEDYSSLNVAAAVQIICYECRQRVLKTAETVVQQRGKKHRDDVPADVQQLEGLYQHLYAALNEKAFFGKNEPEKVMRRLKGLFNRADLTKREVAILHGICSTIEGKKQ